MLAGYHLCIIRELLQKIIGLLAEQFRGRTILQISYDVAVVSRIHGALGVPALAIAGNTEVLHQRNVVLDPGL